MENLMNNNVVNLSGKIALEPIYSHQVFGEGFYESAIEVERLSSQMDVIPITISERLMQEVDLEKGDFLTIEGQFRSYNKVEDGKSKLMLTVFVRELLDSAPIRNPNSIVLSGYICKPPVYRTTPFNREIADILIAVNRSYNKSDYIPCIAWGRNARFCENVPVGTEVRVIGRVQSRQYEKKYEDGTSEIKIAYEVSVSSLEVIDEADNTENEEVENKEVI